jgi:mannan endo-1,4-beta-mannosidase
MPAPERPLSYGEPVKPDAELIGDAVPEPVDVLPPVTAGASAECRALVDLLHRLSGRALLSGQHNQPAHGSGWSERIAGLVGTAPAVWGMEIGFSAPGTIDAVDRREANLAEAVSWHERGAVIACTWHAVCPVDDEPVAFEGGILRDDFTADQYDEVLTRGSGLHSRWCAQVDVAADVLRTLQDAGVPVLWRPYHEMNGPWFWWGGQPDRARALWRQLFDRLTVHHGLRNLVWVWNPNAPYGSAAPFEQFYPGHDVVDALAVDTYGGHYEAQTCSALLGLAGGRPIGLGEVGALPPDEVMEAQSRWAWFMGWPGKVTAENTEERIREVYENPRVLDLEGLVALRA